MANTLTDLIPSMYEALDVVSRELTGFIPAVNRDSRVERAALNQQVLVPITEQPSGGDNTPATNVPDDGDDEVTNVPVTISKSKYKSVRFEGEETLGLENAGTFSNIMADRLYQAMRGLVNEIEADCWGAAYQGASRAYGTAGTTPFATANDMSDFAGALRILEENGAPTNDLQLVLGHGAIANLRGKQSSLFKVNESGSSDMLRNGMTDRIMKFAIRHSDGVGIHTKGTGTSYLVNDASAAIGDTAIATDGGSGTLLAGDVVTFAGDTDKYVANSALAAGTFNIGGPGLRSAVADDAAITIGNSFTANVAFSRSAILLATRAPALPKGGDMAVDRMQITDDVSGLTFDVALYAGFHRMTIHVALAWGFKNIKPAHTALLLG